MTPLVTADEARTINQYFRAVKVVRELNEAAEVRYLTSREGQTLRDGMGTLEALRGQVRLINERSFNHTKSDQVAA
jgi:hypothetical protein